MPQQSCGANASEEQKRAGKAVFLKPLSKILKLVVRLLKLEQITTATMSKIENKIDANDRTI